MRPGMVWWQEKAARQGGRVKGIQEGELEGRGGVRRRSLRELFSSSTILQHVHHVHTFGML